MSWNYTVEGTPAEVQEGFEQHIVDVPLQGHEKVARGKLKDIIVEVGKDYAVGEQMVFTGSGDDKVISVSITPA